jgi:hypothetical protein
LALLAAFPVNQLLAVALAARKELLRARQVTVAALVMALRARQIQVVAAVATAAVRAVV